MTEEQIVQSEDQQTPDPTPKLSITDFAAKIKLKYPSYSNLNDTELVNKVIAKYPQYKERIQFNAPTSTTNFGMGNADPVTQMQSSMPKNTVEEGSSGTEDGVYAPISDSQPYIPPYAQVNQPSSTAVKSNTIPDKPKQQFEAENAGMELRNKEVKQQALATTAKRSKRPEAEVQKDIDAGKLILSSDGKGNKIYARQPGAGESFIKGMVTAERSLTDATTIAYTKATGTPEELAFLYETIAHRKQVESEKEFNLADELGKMPGVVQIKDDIKKTTELPTAAPSTVGGLAEMGGALAADMAMAAGTGGLGVAAKTAVIGGKMYTSSYGNKAFELYERGKQKYIQDGMDEKQASIQAAQDATNDATGAAIPDAAVNTLFFSGKLHSPAANNFVSVMKGAAKDAVKVGALGMVGSASTSAIEGVEGYKVDDWVEKMVHSGGEFAKMDMLFKIIPILRTLPKAAQSAVKEFAVDPIIKPFVANYLKTVPEGINVMKDLSAYEAATAPLRGVVSEEKMASLGGRMQKRVNRINDINLIKEEIKLLEEKKAALPEPLHEEINASIEGKNAAIKSLQKEIGTVDAEIADINKSEGTGLEKEVDELTGEKILPNETPIQQEVQPQPEVSKVPDVVEDGAPEVGNELAGGDLGANEAGKGEVKSDTDIEKRMAEIEGNKTHLEEFNNLEKEMEKRERASVFNAPLEKVNDFVDALMQKEKDKPNGFGSFIERRDARLTKEVVDRYLNAKELTDAELKKDFADAVRGNPTIWYADGLKMREALKEATARGIDTKEMLAEVTKVYTDAGYDIKEAKSVVANMLKPIFEGSQKVNEKQIENEPTPTETTKPIQSNEPIPEGQGVKEAVPESVDGVGQGDAKAPITVYRSGAVDGDVAYFAETKAYADTFAGEKGKKGNAGVTEMQINPKNVLDISDSYSNSTSPLAVQKILEAKGIEFTAQEKQRIKSLDANYKGDPTFSHIVNVPAFIDAVKRAGFDAIKQKETTTVSKAGKFSKTDLHTSYAVVDPSIVMDDVSRVAMEGEAVRKKYLTDKEKEVGYHDFSNNNKQYQKEAKQAKSFYIAQNKPFKENTTAQTKRIDAKKLYEEINKFDEPEDAYGLALAHIAGGGKVSEASINSLLGVKEKRRLNTGAADKKSDEVKGRDYASKDGKSIESIAQDIWNNLSEEKQGRIPDQDILNALEEVVSNENTRLSAAEKFKERYDIDATKKDLTDEEAQFISDEMAAAVNEAADNAPAEIQKEVEAFLEKYNNNGIIDWVKLEEDSKGFNPDFLGLSEEASAFIDNVINDKLYGESKLQILNGEDTGASNDGRQGSAGSGEAKNAPAAQGKQNEPAPAEAVDKVKPLQLAYDNALKELKTAEDKLAKEQAKQGSFFNEGQQKGMFAPDAAENKAILDPLKAKVKEAREALDTAKKEAEVAAAKENPDMFEGEAANKKKTKLATTLAEANKKPISVKDITEFISDVLDLPIRKGMVRWGERIGIYKVKAEVVRLKNANDVGTLMHEVAHHVDKKNFNRKFPFKDELKLLDYDQSKQRPFEGFAEFVRMWATGDANLSKAAPKFLNFWENTFLKPDVTTAKGNLTTAKKSGNKPAIDAAKIKLDEAKNQQELASNLKLMKQYVDIWKQQGSMNRVLASFDSNAENPKEKSRLSKWGVNFIDKSLPLKYFVNTILDAKGVTRKQYESDPAWKGKDPYLIANVVAKTAGAKARQWVLDGVRDFSGRQNFKSLKEVIAPVNTSIKEAVAYVVSLRRLDRNAKGFEYNLNDIEDAQFIADKYKNDAAFNTFATEITEWNSHLINYLVDAGRFTQEAAQKILKSDAFYIPLKTLTQESEIQRPAKAKGVSNTGKPVGRFGDKGEQIVDPLEAMIQNTEKIIGIADKSRVVNAMLDMSEGVDGLGKIIEEVPAPLSATKSSVDAIKKQLEDAGIDLADADMDAMLTIFSASNKTTGLPENIIPLYRNGKLKYYQVDPVLYKAVAGLDVKLLGFISNTWVGKALAASTKLTRMGATGSRAGFQLISNPFRDFFTGIMQTRGNALNVPVDNARAMVERFKNNSDIVKRYKGAGVEMGTPLGMDRRNTQQLVNEAISDPKKRKLMNIAMHPLEALGKVYDSYIELVSFPESIPRIAEYTKIYNKYGKLIEDATNAGDFKKVKELEIARAVDAADAANEITLNFKKAGIYAEAINQIVFGFNPAIRGLSKMTTMMKEMPGTTIARGVLSLTVPSLALYLVNRDEEWYKNLPEWEKHGFFHFKVGDKIIRLPKPFEWGWTFSTIPESIMESVDEGELVSLKNGLLEGTNVLPPMPIPDMVKPAMQAYFDWDLFRMKTITPRSETDLLPEYQYGKNTTPTAKKMGEILGLSPRKIDFLLSGYTGGMAIEILNALPKEYKEATDLPVIGRLFVRKSAMVENGQYTQDFYDIFDRAKKLVQTQSQIDKELKEGEIKMNERDTYIYENAGVINQVATNLSQLRKEYNELEKEPMQRELKEAALDAISQAQYLAVKELLEDMKITLRTIKK